jgi:hypothetical protein
MTIQSGRVFTHEEDSLCAHCQQKIFRNRYSDDNSLSPWLHTDGSGVWCRKLRATPVLDPGEEVWEDEGGRTV